MTYAVFIEKWTDAESPRRAVPQEELARVESAFGRSLPTSFKSAFVTYGIALPDIDLLDAIADQELDIPDVQQFFAPDDMIELTEEWREFGLPPDCVAIGADCMGSLFCFRAGGDAVWYWDHDTDAIKQIAADFDTWIDLYCAIER
jgi:hypothetical protein